jgi:Fic family protein
MQSRTSDSVAWGRTIKCGAGDYSYLAFVPSPLPPEISWSENLVSRLSSADRAIGRLAGVGRILPNPHLLIGPFKRREAVLSSRIEGTQASLADLYLFEEQPGVNPAVPDVREVANHIRALDYGLARLAELPLCNRLIREMHGILMEGVRGQEQTPGEFRRSQNWIGPRGCTLADATYVPPPPDALNACLGNGRIGRLLIVLLLCTSGVLTDPLLYVSAFFEKHRDEYYRLLLAVSERGAWDDWIDFFLRGVCEEASDAVERASRLVDLRATYRERFHLARSSALLLKLIDGLFERPALTVAGTRRILGITARAAQLNIDKLVAAGVLRESTGNARNRVWVADEIRSAIEL